MEIKLTEIPVSEVVNGYKDNEINGVTGYGGRLNIRPAFQREFVYDEEKRNAVIDTVTKGFPLNVMYWCDDGSGNYELLDGQQRTVSICQYCNGDFSLNNRFFNNLTQTEKKQIEDYKLMIYICNGNDKEKLDWFKTINIAGEKLFPQELRNAIYTGQWLTDAKKHFSKTGCPAAAIGDKLVSGSAIRQDYLETAIKWLALTEGKTIEGYMSEHQHDTNASPLWLHFQAVINWVNTYFTKYRKEMKGIDWGRLYHEHRQDSLNPGEIESKTAELMMDDEVTSKKGIYEYLLTGREKFLNLRQFSESQKRQAYEKQGGVCPNCGKHFEFEQMEGDHHKPWCKGGKTDNDNCVMLCRDCNREKSGK
ncbi:MAG: DUF262 domain-containing protein [Ruminococcus sp.]|nr:DUF262 domain-containing protein [Ruminococcus sp.]